MAVAEQEIEQAENRMEAAGGGGVCGVGALRSPHVAGRLSTDVQVAVPARLVEGLAGAAPADLAEIEVSPAGIGLRWPRLDADVDVPAFLQGVFDSKRWMAAQLGATGGKVVSAAKAAASRANGRKGGRPRRAAQG